LVDIDKEAVDLVNSGVMPFIENGTEEILKKLINANQIGATTDLSVIANSSIIITTLGTPVDEFQSPVPRIFVDFLNSIKGGLRSDQLFILRSTVYPGTSRWMANQLEHYGVDLAFCPERITQGNAMIEIYELPQIVSGATPRAVERASELFRNIGIKIVDCTIEEAELAKLYLNAFRYAQFAISNEFYRIAIENGLDYSKIYNVMTSDYKRGSAIPKAGLAAGPCLLKDTQQLIAFSNNTFLAGNAAVLANEGLPMVLIRQLESMIDLRTATVGILGMAFKSNSDDIRSSLSYRLKKLLQIRSKLVLTTDPYVSKDANLLSVIEVIDRSDILVICTPHSEYKSLNLSGKKVLDIWG
ncbi:nucleotide sugar dehydrogenase, partial [bacterium]|nr:nucleotide sugar dehydrogenase [bacterium]